MYYEQSSNGYAQILNGGNILCSVQTTLAGGSLFSFSYLPAAVTAAAAAITTAAAAAVAAITAEDAAADNTNSTGSPCGDSRFFCEK